MHWLQSRYRYVQQRTKPYALAVFIALMMVWAGVYLLERAERPMIAMSVETKTMVEWTHSLPGGGQIHVVVYRRDYETEQDYDDAVAAKLVLYPPDPPSGG